MRRFGENRVQPKDPEAQPAGETLAAQAESVLQRAIISGELAPEARLTLPSLEARYGFGATPLREALSRLVARGLVTMTGNKGFSVSAISRRDLEDLIRARSVIEEGALRMSIERHDGDWEDRLISAMHRLKRIVRQAGDVITDGNSDYDAAHRAFHSALIGGCGTARLIEIQGELFDQAYRYRRVMGAVGLDSVRAIEVHQKLVDLALGDDIEAACSEIKLHLRLTLEAVYPDA